MSMEGTVSDPTTVAPADPNTGAGLIEFLDAAIEKGWLNVSSAKALRTATLKIFDVESGWENMDLRSLDSDALFERFRNLKRNAYNDDSIRVYKTRFGQALKMHLARLDGDANWRMYGPAARAGGLPKAASSAGTAKKPPSAHAGQDPRSPDPGLEDDEPYPAQSSSPGTATLVRFPFPLRDTTDVWLALPRDLTREEADRLSIFIGSLARHDAPTSVPASVQAAS